jgi:O-glycosyl hydrolase
MEKTILFLVVVLSFCQAFAGEVRKNGENDETVTQKNLVTRDNGANGYGSDLFTSLGTDGGSTFAEAANPDKTGINTTDKCVKSSGNSINWYHYGKISGSAVSVTSVYRYLHVKVKAGSAGGAILLIRDGSKDEAGEYQGDSKKTDIRIPVTTAWTETVIDLQDKGITQVYGFYFGDQIWSDGHSREIYWDEIVLNNDSGDLNNGGGSDDATVTVNAATKYQTIEGFAASDCWMGNFVGKWNGDNKAAVAKYLFSQNFDGSGNPEGIGLSMWRFNLGAGTYELGSASNNIGASDGNYVSRRAESFLQNIAVGGVYDWTKCAGQRYFLQQAKNYGCESFVAFSNSPVLPYTKNGQGYSSSSANANINNYNGFADYMATVVKHFKDEGYNFKYISPVNEPQWEWNKNEQEGSPWTSAEIKNIVTALNTSIATQGLTNTKILIPEVAQWDYAYGQSGKKAGNQIYEFFDTGSSNYIGNLASVAPVIAGHSYWKDKKNSDIKSVRQQVKSKADQYNLGVHQTEWSMMEIDGVDGFPSNWDYIDVALDMAKIIHSDMAYANAASWSFWTAMDMERWSQKNRFMLVRVKPNNSDYPTTYTQLETQGAVTAEPNLWALGNYSLFVRPGYQRIQLTGADDMAGLMGTAYVAPDHSKIVAVYVNMGNSDSNITMSLNNPDATLVSADKYVTSASSNLKKSAQSIAAIGNQTVSIPKRSVTTLVYTYTDLPTLSIPVEEAHSLQVHPNPVKAGETLWLSSSPQAEITGISFSNLNGQIILKQSTVNGSIQIPQYMTKGIYLLSVDGKQSSVRKKIIVQ